MTPPLSRSSLGLRRQLWGCLVAVLGCGALVVVLTPSRGTLNLASDLLVFLVLVVAVALLGGLGPSLLAAVLAAGTLNYWFTDPVHSFTIKSPNNLVALAGFAAVAAMVSWVVDVAARRQEAAAAAAELEAGNRLRTALLAAVGHDLRTPLATAKAVVSGLRGHVQLDESDREELLETADAALDQLAALVDNLLDMSRLQSGAMPMRVASVPLDDVVARALDDVRVEPRGVVLDIDEELPPVLADAGLLERVVANLVANAQRYSPPGRPPSLTTSAAPGRVELHVVDHGPGIPPEARDRVFLPFQRLGDTDTSSGLGLGLAVSRGLVEAMGGTLEPVETAGGGLTMVVTLPAAAERR